MSDSRKKKAASARSGVTEPTPRLLERIHRVADRGSIQGFVLFVLALVLYTHELNDRPGFPHFFEENTLTREMRPGLTPREVLRLPLLEAYRIFRQWGNGDVDHAGSSFPWVLAVHLSRTSFGETVFAHRLPSAVLAAFSPVVFLMLLRRFYRRDVTSFLAALLLATAPFQLTFSRNGGYVAATMLLLLVLLYSALVLSLEDRLKAWTPVTVCLVLVPYFYAPIRYLCLVAVACIAYRMARDCCFRQRHRWCAVGCVAVLVLSCIPNVAAKNEWRRSWTGSVLHVASIFYGGSGEQFFSAQDHLKVLLPEQPVDVDYGDPTDVLKELLAVRTAQWFRIYVKGAGADPTPSWNPPARYQVRRLWPRPYLPVLALLGFGYSLWLGLKRKQRRYLLLPIWSCMTWVPLLLTTQVNANRTLLGLPADLFLVSLGAFLVLKSAWALCGWARGPSLPLKPAFDIAFRVMLGWLSYARALHYFDAVP